MNIILPINEYFDLDIGLLQAPFYSPDLTYLIFGLSGEILNRQNPKQRCPLTPEKLPGSLNKDMVQIYFDDYVSDCALDVLFNRGYFNHIISAASLPQAQKKFMNTSEYWLVLPPLYQQFPNMMMQVEASAKTAPDVTFSPQGISGAMDATATVFVLPPGANPKQVFVLDLKIIVGLYANIRPGNNIWANLTNIKCNFTLQSSQIGPLAIVPLIDFVLEPLCSHYIPELANYVLNIGITIPSAFGFHLITPVFGYGKGYFGFSSSVKYIG